MVEPVRGITGVDMASFEPAAVAQLESLYERIRGELARLDRYTDTADRDLLTQGKDLATHVRSLTRALGGRGELGEQYQSAMSTFSAMISANTTLRAELSEITGDPLPEVVPELLRDPRAIR